MHTEELSALKSQYQDKPLSRRDFVRVLSVSAGTGLVTAGLSGFALTPSQRAEAAELIVEDLGKLPTTKFGRLPFQVSAISMSQDWSSDLLAPALAVGVNFIHKAGYWNNVPEEIKKLPRESYYTDITVDNTPRDPDNYDRAYSQVKNSLDKNGLKYYDIFRAHFGWHSPDKVKPENNTSYKAFLQLKKEGLVKYFGVSQHPYDGTSKEDITKYALMTQACIDSGIIDAMQVWYSYGYPKEVMDVFAKASAAGIGMTAMKINAHGRDKMGADVDRQKALKAEGMVGRALIRDVMTEKRPDGKPIFQTCVSALRNQQIFEENVGGVSKKVALRDGFHRFQYEV
jgi:hypothetical protein